MEASHTYRLHPTVNFLLKKANINKEKLSGNSYSLFHKTIHTVYNSTLNYVLYGLIFNMSYLLCQFCLHFQVGLWIWSDSVKEIIQVSQVYLPPSCG